jgi:hypothetical protein
MAAAAKPFPSEERTPPVIKINLVRVVVFGDFMDTQYSSIIVNWTRKNMAETVKNFDILRQQI